MKKYFAFLLSALMLVNLFSITSMAKKIGEKPFALFYIDPPLYENAADKTKQTFEITEGDSLAYRFSTSGSSAKMTGFWVIHTSEDEVTYDVRVYQWAYNYENTISQTPVAEALGVEYKDPDTNADEWFFVDFGTSIAAGEYLVVWDNLSGGTLTECKFTPDPCFRPYLNGEPTEDFSLWWAIEFDVTGGKYNALPLADDCEVPESTESSATSETDKVTESDATTDESDAADSTKQDTNAPANTEDKQTNAADTNEASSDTSTGLIIGIVVAVVVIAVVVVAVVARKKRK